MKKISIILILSFIHYCLGCYSTKILKNEESCQHFYKPSDPIYVKTKERETYFYANGTYTFKNDTLYGYGRKVLGGHKHPPQQVTIPCDNIRQIEIRKPDNTVGVILIVSATIAITVGLAIGLSEMKGMGNMSFK
jgi:hypothetical protein